MSKTTEESKTITKQRRQVEKELKAAGLPYCLWRNLRLLQEQAQAAGISQDQITNWLARTRRVVPEAS